MTPLLPAALLLAHVALAAPVWPEVDLPRAPTRLPGVAQPEISLNETTGDGTWRFLLDVPDFRASGIPRPMAARQDFDFAAWASRDWCPIRVPGEPAMQGFDIKANEEYYYRREVRVPDDWAGKRILLRFDGVYSNARVWVGARHVRNHVGGFTTWDCDLTDLVRPGETFTLTVGVADLQGKDVGLWNPEGRPVKNPANASEYAHHNIGGILRDVSLVALPQAYLADLEVETDLDDAFRDATLKARARLNPTAGEATLRLEVLDGDRPLASAEATLSGSAPATLALPVKAPRLWDAEHPHLHTLRATLSQGGKTLQVNEQRIGFRELTFGGRDGTDANKLYVNGRPVRLRGTCRHDVSPLMGRSMTRAEAFAEARAYKEANINFIRTSHYPASEDLLDACDELGIYVEQEAAVCFQGPWAPVHSVYDDYAAQFVEMVERDRSRPSIILWSIANESHYANVGKTLVRNPFADSRDYLRARDPSRPCIFSFPGTGEPADFMDIHSLHYANVMGNMGRKDKPVLHDEYAHIPCYNLAELRRDTNVRNFWGESVHHAWDHIVRDDGALGGALWGGIDDIFYLPPNVPERYLRHSDGPAAGYGEWGSVLDAYLRLKPEAWLTKKAYSPIRLDEKAATLQGDTLTLPAENRFDHTDLAELTVAIAADGAVPRTVPCPALAPRAKGTLTFGGLADAKAVNLRFRTADGIVVEEVNLALAPSAPAPEPTEPAAPPTLVKDADTLTVRLDDGEATFDRATARLRAFVWQGRTLLADGPDLIATGVNLGAWQGRTLTAKTEGNRVLVSIEGSYACDLAVRFDLAFLADGRLEARYTLLSDPPKGAQPSEVGLAFALPGTEAIRWERTAFHSAYPADHIGRPRGVAHRVRPGSDISPDVYGSKPAWPWKDDMRNPFVYAKDDPDDGLATNDFKAMREAIRAYDVLLPGGGALRLRSDGKSQAARVAVSADRMLIDDRDPRVRYSAGWAHYATPADHAGTETYSTRRDAWAELAFEGAGIRVIGAKQANVGLMRILLDGREVATVDTHSDLGSDLKQSVIHTVHGLAPGKHTVRVETAGGHVDCVVVDAFEVLPAEGPRIATRLIVCDGWWYPGLAWGNYCGRRPAFAKGTSGKADLRPLPTAPSGWSEETQPPTQGGSAAKSR